MSYNPKIQVNKQGSMIDEPIHMQIIGLMPNEPIQLTATRISSGAR